jgi:hypothetical protein
MKCTGLVVDSTPVRVQAHLDKIVTAVLLLFQFECDEAEMHVTSLNLR